VWAHHEFLSPQIAEVEAERLSLLRTSADASMEKVRPWMMLKGIGSNGSWLVVMACFGWRDVQNRREVGG